LHDVSNISGIEVDVGIVLVKGQDRLQVLISVTVSMKTQLAFVNPNLAQPLSANIYEAKKDRFKEGVLVPQAASALAGASYCPQHK
jgi:hypothetical protein